MGEDFITKLIDKIFDSIINDIEEQSTKNIIKRISKIDKEFSEKLTQMKNNGENVLEYLENYKKGNDNE
ncbi:MAG: hypothetical protein H8E72_07455 [Candidatus Marinimicrobia bacterium]|nr:hypothetical protein [Candidatus Neomarinimicrobiota bacterium]